MIQSAFVSCEKTLMATITPVTCYLCKKTVDVSVPAGFFAAGINSAVIATCPECAAEKHLDGEGLFIELAHEPANAVVKLGCITVTRGALAALADSRQHIHEFLERHANGDWGQIGSFHGTDVTGQEIASGELATEDSAKQNKIALTTGQGRVMSSYLTRTRAELWVLTTLGTSETTVLLPEEY
jgi:hypothetical protein